MPEAPMLKAVRQEIDYNFAEFTGIVEAAPFKKIFKAIDGEKLKKLPQGYSEDNAAIEYLKMKSFTAGYNFPDSEMTKGTVKKVVDVFAAMRPFIDFLNRAVS